MFVRLALYPECKWVGGRGISCSSPGSVNRTSPERQKASLSYTVQNIVGVREHKMVDSKLYKIFKKYKLRMSKEDTDNQKVQHFLGAQMTTLE